MKLTIRPEHLQFVRISKHRNSKKHPIQYVDASGAPIKGDVRKHYLNVVKTQQVRFDTKMEAFSLLSQQELKDLYTNGDKSRVKSSVDKIAVKQAYYNSCFNAFTALNNDDLASINGAALEVLDSCAKEALNDVKLIRDKESRLQNQE